MRRYLFTATALSFAISANAGTLAPTRASSVVELNSAFGSGQCPIVGFAADSRNNADGAVTSGFTVPAGQVLVVTNVDFTALAASGSGDLISFDLWRERVGFANQIASDVSAVTGLDGEANAQLSVNQAVVKSGVTVCVACFDHTTHNPITNAADCNGVIHGFLARDS
jgi:hypothetical protein